MCLYRLTMADYPTQVWIIPSGFSGAWLMADEDEGYNLGISYIDSIEKDRQIALADKVEVFHSEH